MLRAPLLLSHGRRPAGTRKQGTRSAAVSALGSHLAHRARSEGACLLPGLFTAPGGLIILCLMPCRG